LNGSIQRRLVPLPWLRSKPDAKLRGLRMSVASKPDLYRRAAAPSGDCSRRESQGSLEVARRRLTAPAQTIEVDPRGAATSHGYPAD
jgi:hypothetical protein